MIEDAHSGWESHNLQLSKAACQVSLLAVEAAR